MYTPSPTLVALNKLEELKSYVRECNEDIALHRDTQWIVDQAEAIKLDLQRQIRELIG